MTRTHEIKLDGYGAHTTLAEDRPVMLLGTAESYGIEMLHIAPGKDWEGLTITATFNAADGTSTDILMSTDGNIAVPTEATAKSGSGRIVFTGVSNGIQRISCDLDYFVVAHSGINGTQSGGVAPSWFEQAARRFMPLGGTTGQVLTKKTDADFEAEWQDSKGGEGGITPTIGDNGNWFLGDTDTGKPSRGDNGKSAYSYAQDGGYIGTEAEFAAKLAEETGTVPENVALLEDVTVDEASGDFIPMLSPNGTEYRLSIGDNGVPAIKNANGETVWSGTSGGSSGGDTGGGTETTWTSGVPYTLTIIADEYVNKTNGAFEAYAGWSRTDYTPCAGAARIVHTGNGYTSEYCAWYDINKNFISKFGISVSAANIPAEIEVPADAAFFVMSTTSEAMNAMTVTPYGA